MVSPVTESFLTQTNSLFGLLHTAQITEQADATILRLVAAAQTESQTELDSLLSELKTLVQESLTATSTTTTTTEVVDPSTIGVPATELEELILLQDLVDQVTAFTDKLINGPGGLDDLRTFAAANDAANFDALRATLVTELTALQTLVTTSNPNFTTNTITDPTVLAALADIQTAFDGNPQNQNIVTIFNDTKPSRIGDSTSYAKFSTDAVKAIDDEINGKGFDTLTKAAADIATATTDVCAQIQALGGQCTSGGVVVTTTTTTSTSEFGDLDLDTIFEAVRRTFSSYASELSLIRSDGLTSFANVLRLTYPGLFPFVENPSTITGIYKTDIEIQRRLRGLEALFLNQDQSESESIVRSGTLEVDTESTTGQTAIETLFQSVTADTTGIAEVSTLADQVFAEISTTFGTVSAELFAFVNQELERDPNALAVTLNRIAPRFVDQFFSRASLVDTSG